MSKQQPLLSYAAAPSVQEANVYLLQNEDGSLGTDDDKDLLIDPSCSCCCACSRRGVGEKGSCCSWLTILILISCIIFCAACGAVIYSVNLMAHLLKLCHELHTLFVLIPVIAGVMWILGILLMIRSFKHRQRVHQRALARSALVQERIGADVVSTSNAADAGCCTCRKVTRCTFSTTFWFIFILLNLVIFAVFGALVWFEVHTLPKNSGHMDMNGMGSLSQSSTIGRTEHNILHITSKDPGSALNDEYDLFYTQGIAHAQERLWQMEFQRAVGQGRLGELTGFNDDVVKIDKLARVMNFYGHAQEAVGSLSKRSQNIIRAYCDGVNDYLGNKALSLPVEFIVLGLDRPRNWEAADVLVWTKIVSYMLSGNMDNELARWDLHTLLGNDWATVQTLLPKFDYSRFPYILEGEIDPADMTGYNHELNPKVEPMVNWANSADGQKFQQLLREARSKSGSGPMKQFSHQQSAFSAFRRMFGPATASNNWVIGSNRTEAQMPIMANDPHLQLMAPSIWILNHLQSPSFYAAGASFVGTPGIIIGHNRNISWSVTNVGSDVQDIFIMKGNETHYEYNNKIFPYVIRPEVITIKHHDDIIMNVRETQPGHYGPIISDLGTELKDYDLSTGPALALRWISLDKNDTTFDAFLGLNTAQNWDDFQNALKSYVAPSQNMIFADRLGNIGYQTTGKVPRRPFNGTGLSPVPGNGTYDWLDWVDFADMPRKLNPAKGYFATANNAVVPPGYKTYLTGDWDSGSDGYRARRITEMITAHNSHTVASVAAMQQDYKSGIAVDMLKDVLKNKDFKPTTPAGDALKQQLSIWDGIMRVGSVETTLFVRWYLNLQTLPNNQTNNTRWDDAMWILNTFSGSAPDANCVFKPTDGSFSDKPSCLDWAALQLDVIAANSDFASQAWGEDVHLARFTHQILGKTPLACVANRLVSHGGDKSTVNVGTVDTDNMNDLFQLHGSSYRHIIDWADVDSASRWIFGPGQSGNILSSSYDDLAQMWADGEYLSMDPSENVNNVLTINP